MRIFRTLCTLLVLCSFASCGIVDSTVSQPGSFISIIGGPGNDEGWSVGQTSDGGYILFGTTTSFGAGKKDFYLVKTDESGVEEWSRTYGGPGDGGGDEVGRCVRQTRDGGYILVGSTTSAPSAGGNDILLVKTDAGGDTSWTRLFGEAGEDFASAVRESPDGGYLIGASTTKGTSTLDLRVIRTDASGTQVWSLPFEAGLAETATDIVLSRDGGALMIGTYPQINPTFFGTLIAKVNVSGTLAGRPTTYYNPPQAMNAIVELADGDFMTAGYTREGFADAIDSFYFRKINSNWTVNEVPWGVDKGGGVAFGRQGPCRGYALVQSLDGGFVGLGYARGSSDVGADFYLVKIDQEGKLQWENTFGGGGEDVGRSLVQTRDGGYIMLGTTKSFVNGENGIDMMLVKVGPNGSLSK